MTKPSKSLLWVGLFAVAMAYLESAVVVYLRRLYGINDLIQSVSPFDPQIGTIELGREAATLVMLLSVGWIAGKKFTSRLGFAVFAFGIWDIFYYIWLRVFIGWPQTLLDPDLLFLIPLPWWGPILSPVLVALLMVFGGAIMVLSEEHEIAIRPTFADWGALAGGILLMLYAFMTDALSALPANAQTLSQLKPSVFNWPVFLIGFAMVVLFVWRIEKPILQKTLRRLN
ncbi:MAG: hypothetical protein DCC59_01260 [Chloroflexi bacterium]|jgi:hypothetical protein|nr:MAG: hypothetical protein DCC59_01260 [Chloroflexota bacterium]